MFVCLNCYTVYNQKSLKNQQCKKCNCNAVVIDELLIPAIIILNQKGYITRFCCSGHLKKDLNSVNAYINFTDDSVLPYLPKGFLYDYQLYPFFDFENTSNNNTIRKNFEGDVVKIGTDIIKASYDLIEWAESLPILQAKV